MGGDSESLLTEKQFISSGCFGRVVVNLPSKAALSQTRLAVATTSTSSDDLTVLLLQVGQIVQLHAGSRVEAPVYPVGLVVELPALLLRLDGRRDLAPVCVELDEADRTPGSKLRPEHLNRKTHILISKSSE